MRSLLYGDSANKKNAARCDPGGVVDPALELLGSGVDVFFGGVGFGFCFGLGGFFVGFGFGFVSVGFGDSDVGIGFCGFLFQLDVGLDSGFGFFRVGFGHFLGRFCVSAGGGRLGSEHRSSEQAGDQGSDDFVHGIESFSGG
jgi:hypothetical protein